MRMHTYLTDDGLDFSATDEHFTLLLSDVSWLSEDSAYLARLGLHELLVNIRNHAYGGGNGAIEVSATATEEGLTVSLTDWGVQMADVQPQPLPHSSDSGGYGLGIIDRAYSEVIYRRVMGRNQWVLRLYAGHEQNP
jgi:anti-sigma regulatory factor (Ser/Thr protein kinase)